MKLVSGDGAELLVGEDSKERAGKPYMLIK